MITHKELENNYRYIEIKNEEAEAKIALLGGHIFHYKPRNKPALLWLSKRAIFKKSKAIRGGIPICFPWFGPHATDRSLPQHGFARTALWELVDQKEEDASSSYIQLRLLSSAETLKVWAFDFDVRLDIHVGKELKVVLSIKNVDTKPFCFTTALHSYFNVSHISNVEVVGLDKSLYLDSLTGKMREQQGNLSIDKEVDRIYFGASSIIKIDAGEEATLLRQKGSNSLVVWNPWSEKAKALADMPDEGYETMLCLETANAGSDERTLLANETHVLEAVFSYF